MFAQWRFAQTICCLATLGLVAAPILGAPGNQAATKQKIYDVRLSADGQLIGQVVTAAGQAESAKRVRVTQKSRLPWETQTDALGRFKVQLPGSGVYRVAVGRRTFTIRAWQEKIAPPTAKTSILCVTGETVRGQFLGAEVPGTLRSVLTNPVVIGLGIAASIALPIALEDDDVSTSGGTGGAGEPAS